MNPDFYDLFKMPEPTPQKIFTEPDTLNELVIVRKQDVKLGIEYRTEMVQVVVDTLKFLKRSGMNGCQAEQDQMCDDLERILRDQV